MSEQPRVTIGIPTYGRVEYLPRSIASALSQTIPCRIVVCDDGPGDRCRRFMERRYGRHPSVRYVRNEGATLWENWRRVAEECDTEFFLWLQDDDVVHAEHADNVAGAFDMFPAAHASTAMLKAGHDAMVACWWLGNSGPMVPMDFITGMPMLVNGVLFGTAAYFSAWTQSPAVAFRNSGLFREMLAALPGDCDMFTERLHLAYIGRKSPVIAIPKDAGMTMFTGQNESQKTRHQQARQRASAVAFLDSFMASAPFERPLREWMGMITEPVLSGMIASDLESNAAISPVAARIHEIVADHVANLRALIAAMAPEEFQARYGPLPLPKS